MSIYTTGEIAKLCGVTVRTVQYYDSRSILVPSALSEGGRRLYSEEDLKRLRMICFLREAGLSINSIFELLQEENSGSTLSLLLEQQILAAREALNQQQARLNMLEALRRGISLTGQFSPESIGDIACQMKSEKSSPIFVGFSLPWESSWTSSRLPPPSFGGKPESSGPSFWEWRWSSPWGCG